MAVLSLTTEPRGHRPSLTRRGWRASAGCFPLGVAAAAVGALAQPLLSWAGRTPSLPHSSAPPESLGPGPSRHGFSHQPAAPIKGVFPGWLQIR